MDRQNEEKNISEEEVVCTFIHLQRLTIEPEPIGEGYDSKVLAVSQWPEKS
jgi:hypothetical protein